MSYLSNVPEPRICFVGLQNLPILAPEFGHLGAGGEQVQQTLLARALATRGWEVSMVVGDYGQPDAATWTGVTTYKAYAPDAGLPIIRFVHPRWSNLWRAMHRAHADIYYPSCAAAQVGQAALFTRAFGRRMIYRVASDADCDPARVLIRYWRDRKLYEFGLRRADAVLVQTASQQGALRTNFAVDGRVAGMLVERPDHVLPIQHRDVTVIWVGNLLPVKRPELLVKLASSLPATSFHVVGGAVAGHDMTSRTFQQQSTAVPNLTAHGHVAYQSVGRLYDRARILINTSVVEGFPNTYLQAWIRGIPVVAFFDPDGIIVREGLGRVVNSIDEMRAAVTKLANDDEIWLQTSRRCLAYMAREHADEQVLRPYLETIESLRSGHAGSTEQ